MSNCNYAGYFHDENQNKISASVCENACDCDGRRTCDDFTGFCKGVARATWKDKLGANANVCKSKDYRVNESETKSKCHDECDCDGDRICTTYGWCRGTARYSEGPNPEIIDDSKF